MKGHEGRWFPRFFPFFCGNLNASNYPYQQPQLCWKQDETLHSHLTGAVSSGAGRLNIKSSALFRQFVDPCCSNSILRHPSMSDRPLVFAHILVICCGIIPPKRWFLEGFSRLVNYHLCRLEMERRIFEAAHGCKELEEFTIHYYWNTRRYPKSWTFLEDEH